MNLVSYQVYDISEKESRDIVRNLWNNLETDGTSEKLK